MCRGHAQRTSSGVGSQSPVPAAMASRTPRPVFFVQSRLADTDGRGESPAPAAHARASNWRLNVVPPPEAAQEGAQGGWRLTTQPRTPTVSASGPPCSPAPVRSRGRGDGRRCMPRCCARVSRQEQAGIGHQAVVVIDADPVGIRAASPPCFRAVFCFKTILPDSEEHPLKDCPRSRA